MSSLSREAELVQNPALGAVLMWRFCSAYQSRQLTADSPPVTFAFLVLPLVLHVDSMEHLQGTRNGLRAFAEKFAQSKDPGADKILAIHDRLLAWRSMSLQALRLGVAARLVSVDSKRGRLIALSNARPSAATANVRPLLAGAEKLGRWFAELTVFEVASILKVSF